MEHLEEVALVALVAAGLAVIVVMAHYVAYTLAIDVVNLVVFHDVLSGF